MMMIIMSGLIIGDHLALGAKPRLVVVVLLVVAAQAIGERATGQQVA